MTDAKKQPIDESFRFSLSFGVAMLVLSIPSLWLARPWRWDLPLYSIVAALVFIPFATTICVYCPVLFVRHILKSGKRGKLVLNAFLSVVVSVGCIFGLAFVFSGFEPIDAWLIAPVTMWAILVLNEKL